MTMHEIRKAKPEEFRKIQDFYYQLIDDMQGCEYHPKWQKGIYPTDAELHDSLDNGELYVVLKDTNQIAKVAESFSNKDAHTLNDACNSNGTNPSKDDFIGAMRLNHIPTEGYDQAKWGIDVDYKYVTLIHMLGVAVKYQKSGVAKEMVNFAINKARKEGQKAMRLDVLCGNLPANRLYESVGFEFKNKIRLFYEDTGVTDFELYELLL